MKASKAVKIKDKIIIIIKQYANLAQNWDIEDEDDFSDFEDAILDDIAEIKDETEE